jgi:hypothetical protein
VTKKRSCFSGVNFTNVQQAAVTRTDPKSTIKLINLTVFFALFGFAHVKAVRRMLVKLSSDFFSHSQGKSGKKYFYLKSFFFFMFSRLRMLTLEKYKASFHHL